MRTFIGCSAVSVFCTVLICGYMLPPIAVQGHVDVDSGFHTFVVLLTLVAIPVSLVGACRCHRGVGRCFPVHRLGVDHASVRIHRRADHRRDRTRSCRTALPAQSESGRVVARDCGLITKSVSVLTLIV